MKPQSGQCSHTQLHFTPNYTSIQKQKLHGNLPHVEVRNTTILNWILEVQIIFSITHYIHAAVCWNPWQKQIYLLLVFSCLIEHLEKSFSITHCSGFFFCFTRTNAGQKNMREPLWANQPFSIFCLSVNFVKMWPNVYVLDFSGEMLHLIYVSIKNVYFEIMIIMLHVVGALNTFSFESIILLP